MVTIIITSDIRRSPNKAEEEVFNAVRKRLKEYGQNINTDHEQAIRGIISIFENPNPVELNRPIVVCAPCGIGKSVIIEEYLAYKVQKELNFGVVVVKERIEQCLESEKSINSPHRIIPDIGEPPTMMSLFAYTIKGYSKDDCSKKHKVYHPLMCGKGFCDEFDCEVKYKFYKQIDYPVVFISHHRLFQAGETKATLGELQKFHRGDTNNRNFIIIDERPNIVDIHTFYKTNIDEFMDFCSNVDALKEESGNAFNLLKLSGSLDESAKKLIPIPPYNDNFKFSERFLFNWLLNYQGEQYNTPSLIEQLIRHGGITSIDNRIKQRKYTVYQLNALEFPGFRTIILDGTAKDDLTYSNSNILLKNIDLKKDNSNLQINIYNDYQVRSA